MTQIVSAVFDSQSEAERAVSELRSAGVRDSALSVIARHEGAGGDYGGAKTEEVKEKGEGLLKGAVAGGGVGALLGIAALAIPGVGPLAAAGAIAASAVPEAAAVGAGVGALTGGLTGLLTKHGVSDEDAKYYEGRINSGGVFVSVDARDAGISSDLAQDILYRYGGHSASRSKATARMIPPTPCASATSPTTPSARAVALVSALTCAYRLRSRRAARMSSEKSKITSELVPTYDGPMISPGEARRTGRRLCSLLPRETVWKVRIGTEPAPYQAQKTA